MISKSNGGILSKICFSITLSLMGSTLMAKPLDLANATLADAGVVNKEQILYWLIKRGEISEDASIDEKAAAVDAYSYRKFGGRNKGDLLNAKFEQKRLKALKKHKVQKSRKGFSAQQLEAEAQADSDVTKTVKVLGVLIDFPDLPYDNNRLSASDTDMYYPSYPNSHYDDLMFSTTGFTGPQGQNLQTGYQYYQAVSGESFFFTGETKGWFTAENNAAYYGGNDDNGDDKAVPELVKEAVTQAVAGMSSAELANYDVEDPMDLDGDGNFDEPDGNIDHVMLFHSSIGEEAGGGVMSNGGKDAIWSHRFFVYTGSNPGYTIPGTGMKVFGYTVQPIDAAAGVVVHEFGHDLGLPDEYDTSYEGDGSPVGSWSVMSGGSWTGSIAGTQPTGFSPYARSYLQERYKGRWVNEQEIQLNTIDDSGVEVVLNEAVNHGFVNQLSIPLPATPIPFKAPYAGEYQYYSNQGNLINNALSFDVSLPSLTPLSLTMKAHWNIEQDYDYAQLMVNGVPIEGNHTKASNLINDARNIITASSADIAGAEGSNNWVDLVYDLSSYAGSSVRISLIYKTDVGLSEYGIVIDNLELTQGASSVYSDDAETAGRMDLVDFSRIDNQRPGAARRYIVQLRSHNGVDAGLDSHSYEPGVLLWLENFSYADNNSNSHPGVGLIGVVDADQQMILGGNGGSDTQIRDATFSLFNQSSFSGDENLSAISTFDDSLDYSAPLQPQSGIILPKLGLTMEVVEQNVDSSLAKLEFNFAGSTTPPPTSNLSSEFSTTEEVKGTVLFTPTVTGGDGNYSYLWSFGVTGATSAEVGPSYTYAASGSYLVTLKVTDGLGSTVESSQTIAVTLPVAPVAGFTSSNNNLAVTFTDGTTGGEGALSYAWQFGDGQTSSAQSPTHTYGSAGTYSVTLTVTDSLNVQSSSTSSVTVTAPVVPATNAASSDDAGSGGGSLGWLTLCLLGWLGIRRASR
ncbi:immune inhibitor A domain-containing protein [Shewanella woodyi]|uniref:immune inhibitor A domain-containing protein n=1 Tax=Shewanella woodyi TaxID=60961 RepID=UPI0007F95552|nr:immune inhibitor A domain-containing protein [Shewanella woodyi]